MGTVVLDANVAIAVFSSGDAHHRRAIAGLGAAMDQGAALLMGAAAYSEILVHALREGQGSLVDDFVNRLRVEIVPADRVIARQAAQLRADNGALRLPDALVVATALVRSAELLTFDGGLRALAQS